MKPTHFFPSHLRTKTKTAPGFFMNLKGAMTFRSIISTVELVWMPIMFCSRANLDWKDFGNHSGKEKPAK